MYIYEFLGGDDNDNDVNFIISVANSISCQKPSSTSTNFHSEIIFFRDVIKLLMYKQYFNYLNLWLWASNDWARSRCENADNFIWKTGFLADLNVSISTNHCKEIVEFFFFL